MKIRTIESVPYRIPVKGFADAYTGFAYSNAALVRILTDEGPIGIGEACAWEPEFYGETIETVNVTLLKEPLKVVDGCLKGPAGSQFGVEIDEDALRGLEVTL